MTPERRDASLHTCSCQWSVEHDDGPIRSAGENCRLLAEGAGISRSYDCALYSAIGCSWWRAPIASADGLCRLPAWLPPLLDGDLRLPAPRSTSPAGCRSRFTSRALQPSPRRALKPARSPFAAALPIGQEPHPTAQERQPARPRQTRSRRPTQQTAYITAIPDYAPKATARRSRIAPLDPGRRPRYAQGRKSSRRFSKIKRLGSSTECPCGASCCG